MYITGSAFSVGAASLPLAVTASSSTSLGATVSKSWSVCFYFRLLVWE